MVRGSRSVRRRYVWQHLVGVILVAGWLRARAGDALGESTPVGDTFVGAALVVITTSLPKVSTVFGSLRTGRTTWPRANIAGTNALEMALLAVADGASREGALLDHVGRADVFLAALAAVLTCISLAGLLLRGKRTVLRLGYDSAVVVLFYVGGLAAVAAMGRGCGRVGKPLFGQVGDDGRAGWPLGEDESSWIASCTGS